MHNFSAELGQRDGRTVAGHTGDMLTALEVVAGNTTACTRLGVRKSAAAVQVALGRHKVNSLVGSDTDKAARRRTVVVGKAALKLLAVRFHIGDGTCWVDQISIRMPHFVGQAVGPLDDPSLSSSSSPTASKWLWKL